MDKKLAVVTGATKGIGLSIAQRLSNDGYFVLGTYVSDYSEAVLACIETDNFKLFQVDASDFEACQTFSKTVKKTFGSISVLINNAGIVRDGLLMSMKESDFDDVINVNLKGAFNMTQSFSRQLLRSKGSSIVNVASVIGVMGNAGQANYAASKAGLIGFSKSLAKEFGSRDVRVNVVAPGFIETEMTKDLDIHDILKNIPLQKLGQVEDIADAVSFLVNSKYITGQIISVCGGMSM